MSSIFLLVGVRKQFRTIFTKNSSRAQSKTLLLTTWSRLPPIAGLSPLKTKAKVLCIVSVSSFGREPSTSTVIAVQKQITGLECWKSLVDDAWKKNQ